MGAVLELEVRPAASPVLAELKELHVAREALARDSTAARNRAKALTLDMLQPRQNAARREHIARQIGAIEAQMMSRIKADSALGKRFEIEASIPGVSRLTAFALLIEMPELGTLEAAQAASLAGRAIVARQSGRWTGRASIRGGRASVRRALYMPALVAARFNPDMQAKYVKLVAAGKPAKVALTAVMRKLLLSRQRPSEKR